MNVTKTKHNNVIYYYMSPVCTGEYTVCVSKLEYADDAALLGENVEQASARVTSIAKESLEEAAMVNSIRKSKVMHVH